MVVVMHAVGSDIVGVRSHQAGGFLVHHLHKGFFRAADMLGDGNRCVIAGLEQKADEKVFQGKLVAFFQITDGFTRLPVHSVGAHSDHIVKIALPEGEKCGHHLGGAGRIYLLEGIPGIEGFCLIQVKETGSLEGICIRRILHADIF